MNGIDLHIRYGSSLHKLAATIEYESSQVIRIRVTGKERTLLLETNYPIAKLSKGRRITWKLREGFFDKGNEKTARLLTDIIQQLEYYLKGEQNKMSKQEYLSRSKW